MLTDSMIHLSEKYSYVTKQDYDSVAGPAWPDFEQFCTHTNIIDLVYNEIDVMLKPPGSFNHPSFCVLPFYGIEYPQKIACCLLPVGTDLKYVKQQMLAGEKPVACQKCWLLEDIGVTSDRQFKNRGLDFHTNIDIEKLYQNCVDGVNELIHYKIDTSSVCNATCITCGSDASSAWAQLERKNKVNPKKIWRLRPENVKDWINYATAKSIGFRGGEPLLSDTNFVILENLIKHGNTSCFISFTTNGSKTPTTRQQKIISQFSNVNFCFSIDGVGPVFEYMRYPLEFSQIEKNIQYCRDNSIHPSVSYTLSNLNVLYHSQTKSWFQQNQLDYILNPVYYPTHFRPSSLSNGIKKHILQLNPTDEIQQLLSNHTNQDDINYIEFCKQIAKQDKWKNIQLKHYLPEFAAIIVMISD